MNYNNLKLELNEGILSVIINRETKMNALNKETIEELEIVFKNVYDDNSIKSVLITGAGDKAFVAGADIKELAELTQQNGMFFAQKGQKVFQMIEDCPKPVIAAVNGFALGGGCELAMACHIRIASVNAKFGQPEVNLGIIPGYGGTQRLTQLVGKGKAMELCLTADMIGAEEAKSLGLVNHVVELAELLEICKKMLTKIMSKGPGAVGIVIESVNAVHNEALNGYQIEAAGFEKCCGLADFKEGTTAFLEKRKANFEGK